MKIRNQVTVKRAEILFSDGEQDTVRRWLDRNGFIPTDRTVVRNIELKREGEPLGIVDGYAKITVEKRIHV